MEDAYSVAKGEAKNNQCILYPIDHAIRYMKTFVQEETGQQFRSRCNRSAVPCGPVTRSLCLPGYIPSFQVCFSFSLL